MKVLGKYRNGNYIVTILEDGTKIRATKDDDFVPAFSENCDCKITDKCSQNCAFCYEGCTREGNHGDLFSYKFIESLHPYTELAMNGNDLDHPQLDQFLQHLKDKNVIANLTVNQNQFLMNYDKLKTLQNNGLINGIGVSLIKANDELCEKMKSLKNVVLHTIVGILSEKDISFLKNKGLKILILGYKDLHRGKLYHITHCPDIMNNKKYLYDNLAEIQKMFEVLSFDNLAINQLDVKRIVPVENWDEFYMGDDGGFTFYIDVVKGEFAKNSLSDERFPIGDLSIDEMFNFIQEKYKK